MRVLLFLIALLGAFTLGLLISVPGPHTFGEVLVAGIVAVLLFIARPFPTS